MGRLHWPAFVFAAGESTLSVFGPVWLLDAVQRYTDGLHLAAEYLVGPQIVGALDGQADKIVHELTSEPSWPTLRAHLLALAAESGEHPPLHLQTAAAGRELDTAGDMAAVLDWRLQQPAAIGQGPLQWLAGIREAFRDHPVWGEYLAQRAALITDLANQTREDAKRDSTPPVWATPGSRPNVAIVGEVAVWRAANRIDPWDRRPTGAGQLQTAAALWQQHLDRSVAYRSDDRSRPDVQAHQASREDRRPEDQQRWPQPPARPNSPPAARL